MRMTCDQARRLLLALADVLEIFEELDDEPDIIIGKLQAIIDDLAVRVQAENDATPPLPIE